MPYSQCPTLNSNSPLSQIRRSHVVQSYTNSLLGWRGIALRLGGLCGGKEERAGHGSLVKGGEGLKSSVMLALVIRRQMCSRFLTIISFNPSPYHRILEPSPRYESTPPETCDITSVPFLSVRDRSPSLVQSLNSQGEITLYSKSRRSKARAEHAYRSTELSIHHCVGNSYLPPALRPHN